MSLESLRQRLGMLGSGAMLNQRHPGNGDGAEITEDVR